MTRPASCRPGLRATLRACSLLALALAAACSNDAQARTSEVVVFAAASLRDVAAEVAAAFEEAHDTRVVFNVAGSNVLAQQIAAAPKADVFLSADERWIDFVEAEGRTVAGSRRTFLGNRLVVVGHADAAFRLEAARDLAAADDAYLALADPAGVPAGRYARIWLESIPYGAAGERTLWDAVAPRVVPTLDVRAALALVASDPDVLGIVYATDVHGSDRVRVLLEPDPATQPAVVYGAVRIASDRPPAAADALYAFLFGEEARGVYTAHGFVAPPPVSNRSSARNDGR